MILGKIKNIGPEIKYLPEKIKKAIDYLKETDFSRLENKKYPIQGDEMFVLISEYKTVPKSKKEAEAHKKYIDIHFIIEGEETMGFGIESELNELIEGYTEENEASLYGKVENETDLILSAGTYVIFFPDEIHRPGFFSKEESMVRKAVVKIAK